MAVTDGKSAIPFPTQTKWPQKAKFTIYEDETATEAYSTQLEEEYMREGIKESIAHIEDLAGIHVQIYQYYFGFYAMSYLMPLASDVDMKLGTSFLQTFEAFKQECIHEVEYLCSYSELEKRCPCNVTSATNVLGTCTCCDYVKEELAKLRGQVLKNTSFVEKLLSLITELLRKRNEGRRLGHEFKKIGIVKHLDEGAEAIAGYIIDRGLGVHREAVDETYFRVLEKSWAQLFRFFYGWDMKKFCEQCLARRWAHLMEPLLLKLPMIEGKSVKKWVWYYGTRVFGADFTECVLFGAVLNIDRNSIESMPLVD